MLARDFRAIPLAFALAGLAALPATVRAQGNTFNPYGNSGYADYREFGNAMYSNNPALPGQSRLNSEPLITKPRANSYQQFTDSLDGESSGSTRGNSAGVPYYQAYQQLNQRYNRVYRPNDSKANRAYEERIQQRETAYAKARAETDPVKRAKLLRQIDQEANDRTSSTARTKSATTAKPAGRSGTQAAGTRAPSPRSLTAPPPPGERRVPPPSPFSNSDTPRSGITRPGTSAAVRPNPFGGTTPAPSTITAQPAPDPLTTTPPPR